MIKFGICSEIFQKWNDINRTIDYVKDIGYDGLEIAPFTLAKYVTDIPSATREQIRHKAEQKGLEIIGLHWVLVGPDGMHINSPDKDVRQRTADYIGELVRFCRDVGGRLIIFGSPKQRMVMDELTYQQAFDYAVETFRQALPICEDLDVIICMEPLTSLETNFCTSAAETLELVKAVDHPNFQMMLDTKAMAPEKESRADLMRKYADYMRHYHANDENLNGPGWGEVDFKPIFDALKEIDYDGYVSVEVFKFEPGPEAIATKSLDHMRQFVR